MFGVGATVESPKNSTIGEAQAAAFGDPALRAVPVAGPADHRRPADQDGRAPQGDRRRHGASRGDRRLRGARRRSARRRSTRRYVIAAERLIAARDEKLFIASAVERAVPGGRSWSARWATAPRTSIPTTASTSAAASSARSSPPTTRSSCYETFNIPPNRDFQNYCMQELNSGMPRCRRAAATTCRRGSCPSSSNKDGDDAAPARRRRDRGPRRVLRPLARRPLGRRDHRRQDLARLRPLRLRQRQGPRIRDDIVRYADLEGDDKIGCAGTVDAYVRGAVMSTLSTRDRAADDVIRVDHLHPRQARRGRRGAAPLARPRCATSPPRRSTSTTSSRRAPSCRRCST